MSRTVLSDLRVGGVCRLTGYRTFGTEEARLADMGILPGCEITLLRIAPLGDPICLGVRDFTLTLRRSVTDRMEVEEP